MSEVLLVGGGPRNCDVIEIDDHVDTVHTYKPKYTWQIWPTRGYRITDYSIVYYERTSYKDSLGRTMFMYRGRAS